MNDDHDTRGEAHDELDKPINLINDADGAAVAALKEALANVTKERDEYLDGWQRIKADVANIRKDELVRFARARTAGKEGVIGSMLPALDSFDMARQSAAWGTVDKNWRSGMEMVYGQIEAALIENGATKIGVVGEVFDPSLHEAVEEISTDDPALDGTVIEVLSVGWKLEDKVIRPSRVKVAHTHVS